MTEETTKPDYTVDAPRDSTTPSSAALDAYLSEPAFDQDEGLSDEDKIVADSFPASDPPSVR